MLTFFLFAHFLPLCSLRCGAPQTRERYRAVSKRGVSYYNNERSSSSSSSSSSARQSAKRAIKNDDQGEDELFLNQDNNNGQEAPPAAAAVCEPAATRLEPLLQRCGASSVMVGSKMYVCAPRHHHHHLRRASLSRRHRPTRTLKARVARFACFALESFSNFAIYIHTQPQ